MNPVLILIYYFFKLIVGVSLWVYYRKTTVVHLKKEQFKGPCIVVSNHPSTVLDPLNVAIHIPRIVHFLANASLFKTRFTNWFFNTFYCIPIERYQDTGGKPLNNKQSFKRAIEFLSGGGCLYIAPEGTSYVDRHLRKVKTGAARIALNTEASCDFKLGLTILPAGLNYSAPAQFRSRLLTVFGDPIVVADYREDWEKNEFEGVKKLTLRMRGEMERLIVHTADETEDRLLERLEVMMENDEKLSPYEQLHRSQKVLADIQTLRSESPERFQKLVETTQEYFAKLESEKICDRALSRAPKTGVGELLLLIVAFPVFLYGYLNHFLPAFVTKKLSDTLNDDIHWAPTYKYVIGLVIYPVVLLLQAYGLEGFLGEPFPKWIYLLSLVPAGLFAEWWMDQWRDWRCASKVNRSDGIVEQSGALRREIEEILTGIL